MKFSQFIQDTQRTLPDLHELYNVFGDPTLAANEPVNLLAANLSYNKGDKGLMPTGEILNQVHMRLGMVGEYAELMYAIIKEDKANALEEIVDQLWYIANDINIKFRDGQLNKLNYDHLASFQFSSNYAPLSFDTAANKDSQLFANVYLVSKLVDYCKKEFAYGKLESSAITEVEYTNLMTDLLTTINNLGCFMDINIEVGMDRVIAKLRQRYPDRFDAEKAANRDLQKEKSIIDGQDQAPEMDTAEGKETPKD